MSEFRIRAKASAVFVKPIEKFEEGVMKGEVYSVGRTGQNHFGFDDIVIYLIDDTLVEFIEPGSGHKMHAIFYYKVLGIYQKIEKRKEIEELEEFEGRDFSLEGSSF